MKDLIKKIGANDKESETFLKLLELGAQPVSVIAKHMGVPRSSMYLVLDNLKKIRLVEEFDRCGIKYVKCIEPRAIFDVLKSRQRNVEHVMELLDERLPELEKLSNKLSITPKVNFFEGKEDVMRMYESVLKEKEFCAFFNPYSVKTVMPEYHDVIPQLLKRNGGRARELLVDCVEAKEYKKKYYSEKHQINILPKRMQFASDIIVCKDRIYMTSYGEDQVSAVVVFNNSLAEAQQVIFDEMWDKISV